ncbi:MAG: TlpA family protein disulfide reductase [Acidimicrobiia bacterium]|nr:TlpA family protein disulfide reductase [Acidimicrobiia bacterium]
MATKSRTNKPPQATPAKKLPIGWIAGGVLAVALMVAMVLSFGSLEDAAPEFGAPAVTGDPLAPLLGAGADSAVGQPIPSVAGADFDGNAVSIGPDDGAQAIVFLAHWCSHCQAEVPAVQEWIDAGATPEGVRLVSVATAMDDTRPNFPASAWLDREGWTPPIVVDDEAQSVMQAFGGTGFPFWVFVSEDGTVAGRASGELGVDSVAAAFESLAP